MNGLVLVGFMATGKSAVGQILAQRLGMTFVDTDQLATVQANKPIPRIFSEDGENAFRLLETRVLEQLVADQRACVIATGGGIVLAERNWPLLKALGQVVCLTALTETVMKRAGSREDRPLLQGPAAEVRQRIEALTAQRQAAYARADWQCATDDKLPAVIAENIIAWRQQQLNTSPRIPRSEERGI